MKRASLPGPELSPETLRRVEILFAPEDRERAQALLYGECGSSLPFQDKSDMYKLERIRFAALKYSDGNLSALERAAKLAQMDWRDLLMASGFAHDTGAHRKWEPKPAGEPAEIDATGLLAAIQEAVAAVLVPLGFVRQGDEWRREGEIPQRVRVQQGLTSRTETRFFLHVKLEGEPVVVLHLPKMPPMGENRQQGYFFRAGDGEEALVAAVVEDVVNRARPLLQRFTSASELRCGLEDGSFKPHLPIGNQVWIF